MQRIVIFASGSGSNAENLISHFSKTNTAVVTQVLCNNERAKVFDRCKRLNIKCSLFSKEDFFTSNVVLAILKKEADYIALAGFLWKIPSKIINAFPNKIINIHPALLPKYGGKGMYGSNVHKAVKANNEVESGITIHFVNENYDEGAVIFQKKTSILPTDSSEMIAKKVLALEHRFFPTIVEQVILNE